LIPGDLEFSIAGGKITPETIGGVIFPACLILVFALVPFLDRAKQNQHYIEDPLRRPVMTSFGIGGGVFLCMDVAAGYIDVLHIAPGTMRMYVVAAALAAWGVSFMLLRFYHEKRKGR
jgi:quinol-cytochrome oxidoreductase complex cytochrome b subunit